MEERTRTQQVDRKLQDQWQVHPDYGMPTTAGMSALLEARNDDSAKLVKKVGLFDDLVFCIQLSDQVQLEEAGLIILGKTNMSVSCPVIFAVVGCTDIT